LTPSSAASLHDWLCTARGWQIASSGSGRTQDGERGGAPDRPGLGFCYETILIFGGCQGEAHDGGLRAFLNAPPFLRLASQVTGRADLVRADGHATRFRAGNFLDLHLDTTKSGEPGGIRRIAFVLGMTRDWSADWGGWTVFPQSASAFSQAAAPAFNQLLLFSVPQPHLVSAVSPRCPASRHAISGWLRSDE
jgi:hypothetical protein